MSQLSLFPKTLREQRLVDQANGLTISIQIKCKKCGKSNYIPPHLTVHTFEWMNQHWINLGSNNYLVNVDDCSACCVIKL